MARLLHLGLGFLRLWRCLASNVEAFHFLGDRAIPLRRLAPLAFAGKLGSVQLPRMPATSMFAYD